MRVRECATQLEAVLRGRPEGALDDIPGHNGNASGNGVAVPALTGAQTAYWQQIKQEFVGLLGEHKQPECAETFFNSVSCRLLHRDYFHNDFLFVRPAVATDYLDSSTPSYRVYYPATDGLEKA